MTPCWLTWKTQPSKILMPFLTWRCLTLSLESQSESIRMDSLRVVVFSLLPSFTCLLLPVTCTPATSSLISIHAARQSHHSGRMFCVNHVCLCLWFPLHFLKHFHFFFYFTATSHTVKLTSVACDTLFTWLNTNKSITHLLEKKTMISFRAFFYLYAVDVVCMTSKDRNTLSYPNYVLVNSKNVLLQLQLRYCCHIDSTIKVLPTPLVNPSLSNYLHLQYVPRVCLLI